MGGLPGDVGESDDACRGVCIELYLVLVMSFRQGIDYLCCVPALGEGLIWFGLAPYGDLVFVPELVGYGGRGCCCGVPVLDAP